MLLHYGSHFFFIRHFYLLFEQHLNEIGASGLGAFFVIQVLLEHLIAHLEKHIGSAECFCYDKKMAGFAAQEHIAEFKDGKFPVQLMVMKCDKFKGKGFDAFLLSQMWDCQEDRERI